MMMSTLDKRSHQILDPAVRSRLAGKHGESRPGKIATTPAVPEENDELADLEIEEAEEEAHENDETVEG